MRLANGVARDAKEASEVAEPNDARGQVRFCEGLGVKFPGTRRNQKASHCAYVVPLSPNSDP